MNVTVFWPTVPEFRTRPQRIFREGIFNNLRKIPNNTDFDFGKKLIYSGFLLDNGLN